MGGNNVYYNFSLSKVDLNFKIHPIQICADIIIGFYYLENRDQQENGSWEESHDLDGSGLGASIMK